MTRIVTLTGCLTLAACSALDYGIPRVNKERYSQRRALAGAVPRWIATSGERSP